MDPSDKMRLTQNIKALTDNLQVDSVIPHLLQEGMLSPEDIELIGREPTSKQKAFYLVNKLMKKGPKAYSIFLESLKEDHLYLFEMLVNTQVKKESFDGAPNLMYSLKKLRAELQNHYRRVHGRLSPIPWIEWVQLSLDNVYTAPFVVRNPQSKPFEKSSLRFTRNQPKYNIHEMLPIKNKSGPKRILMEGDPGSGKSTTMCKLVHDWSKCSKSGEHGNINQYQLVFLLKASDLCQTDDDLATIIMNHLLPEDANITKDDVKLCIEANQEKTLLIVDGYDESQGNVMGSTLDKLLQGKCLRQADILVSSRCAFMSHLMKYFTDAYVLVGYDKSKREEFIKKFGNELGVEECNFSNLLDSMKHDWSVKEICRNPFNLSILCLLSAEENQSLSCTRTGIITELFDFIVEKSLDRLCLDRDEIDSILKPLYKVSFDSLMQNQTSFEEWQLKQSGCDPKRSVHLGFLKKEVRVVRLRSEVHYTFSHRSFYEYFAAKYLVDVPRDERRKALKSIVRRKGFRMTCKFLFGLLRNQVDGMVDFIESCDEVLFSTASAMDFKDISIQDVMDCHIGHLPYQALCEIDGLIPDAVSKTIKARAPKQVCFSPLCGLNCVKGFLKMCDVLKHPRSNDYPQTPLCVIMPLSCQVMKPDVFEKFFYNLTRSGVSSVGLFYVDSADQLKSALYELKIGDPSSLISELRIKFVGAVDGFQCIEFGNCMTGLEVIGCRNGALLTEILKGIPDDGKVDWLSVTESDVNSDACQILAKKLAGWNTLKRFKLTGHALNAVNPAMFCKVLLALEDKNTLESFSVSHLPTFHYKALGSTTPPDEAILEKSMKVLETILTKNKLKLLSFYQCSLDTGFFNVLQNVIDRMEALELIAFKACLLHDAKGFDDTMTKVKTLANLRHFEITHVEISDSNFASIKDFLKTCHKLETLGICKANGSLMDQITEGLENSKSLKCLKLKEVAFPEETMSNLCSVLPCLTSLSHLEVSLHLGNYIKENQFTELFTAITSCPSLTELNLCFMGINDEVMGSFCYALKTNKTITHLHLQDNQFGADGVAKLASCLAIRKMPLKLVNLTNCPVKEIDPAVEALQQHCSHVSISTGTFYMIENPSLRRLSQHHLYQS